jgi:hypothetical protein
MIQSTEFHVPEGCKTVECSNNQLTSLTIPEGCEEVYCHINKLTSIKLPASLKILCIDEGVLTPEQLQWCEENNVTVNQH